MSELGNKRPIPPRSFSIVAASAGPASSRITIPWQPSFTVKGGQLKVTFSPGTVNGFLPDNFQDEFKVEDGQTYYAKIRVKSGATGVSKVALLVENNTTIDNKFNKKIPATEFTFILGAINGKNYSMTANTPISVTPYIAYYEQRSDAKAGELPYDIYYGWAVN
jgi:hypothetical protein